MVGKVGMEITYRRSFVSMLMAAPALGFAVGSDAYAAEMPALSFRAELMPTQDQIWSWVDKVKTGLGAQRLKGDESVHASQSQPARRNRERISARKSNASGLRHSVSSRP